MERSRHDLLAGTGVAQQQRGRVRGGDLLDLTDHAKHWFARCDHALQGARNILSQGAVLRLETPDVKRAIDDQAENLGVDRFLIEIVGAHADGAEGIVFVAVPGDHDDFRARRQPLDLGQRVHALADAVGLRRQAKVEQHHLRFVAAQVRDGALPVLGEKQLVAVERPAELACQPRIVLHDEQTLGLSLHDCCGPPVSPFNSPFGPCSDSATGRRSVNTVPTPGVLSTATSPPAPRAKSRA